MLLVASHNGAAGMDPAWHLLATGGSALDAVEAAVRVIEDDPDEHTVGYGGYPNLLGEVELDASIMDGTTHRAGAFGALRGYRAAITIARQVMERTPHVLLVGEGARRFAAELGHTQEDLLTGHAHRAYSDGLDGRLPPEYRNQDGAITTALMTAAARAVADPESAFGTVNFLVQDRAGRIAFAVSSSGWAFKYPGRLGDTPIIGAGNYADDRYGAATCMGWGELTVRAGTSRAIVAWLQDGLDLATACRRAVADLRALDTQGGAGHYTSSPSARKAATSASRPHPAVTTSPGPRA